MVGFCRFLAVIAVVVPAVASAQERRAETYETPRTAALGTGARASSASTAALANNAAAIRFAETLALHAQNEEEILYPAALLVGDIVRARLRQD